MRHHIASLLPLLLPAALAAQPAAPAPSEGGGADGGAAVRVVSAAPAAGAIRIDGRLDEAAWAAAQVATGFTESYPNPGEPARQRTEARITYGGDALFVAVRMFDTAPDSIVGQLARRDAAGIYSDWVHLIIDSYHDRRTAFRFSVNPKGVKRDVYHFDDGREDGGWDAVWEVATQVDSLGWTAEYRIPLSQLRFSGDEPAGGRTWGLQIMRDIARYESRDSWSPWTRNDNGFVSRFGTLAGLTGLGNPRRMEIRPYSVARLTRAPAALHGGTANPFYRASQPFASVGADAQIGLTSNFTLTATINPDFGQVEADPSQVNLSANESFFSERRPFFLEGMDLFRFGTSMGDGGSEQLFYSRRIGRLPQRRIGAPGGGYVEPIDNTTILGAVKLTGRTPDGWSVGVLNAVTGAEHSRYTDGAGTMHSAPTEPLSNYAIARARRDFRGGQSALGGVLTTVHRRIDNDALDFLPSSAYTGGVDGRHRFAGNQWEVSGWLLGSHVTGDTLAIQRRQRSPLRYYQRPDATHVEYDPTRTSLSGASGLVGVRKTGGSWRVGGDLLARSPGFETNDGGFQQDADMLQIGSFVGYVQNQVGSVFRRWNLFANGWSGGDFAGDRLFSGMNLNGSYQLKNFWNGWGGINYSLHGLATGALRGGPAMYRPGAFNSWAGLNSDGRKPVVLGIDGSGSWENDTDGHSYNVGVSASWRPSTQLDLSLRPSFSASHTAAQYVAARSDAATGQTRYVMSGLDQTQLSLTARANYTFSPTLSLQFYAQPFVAAGEYSGFMEVADPRAARFADRYAPIGAAQLRACDGFYGVRGTGTGCGSDAGFAYRIGDPNFSVRQLRTNAVVRWEYRPGSALFLVWQQNRDGFDPSGDFALRHDARELLGAPATNVFLVKGTYWIGK